MRSTAFAGSPGRWRIWPALSELALPIWLKPLATGVWKLIRKLSGSLRNASLRYGAVEGFAQTRCQAAQASGQTRLRTPSCQARYAPRTGQPSRSRRPRPASPRKALRAFQRSLCVSLSVLVQQPQHRRTQAPSSPSQRNKLDIQISWCPAHIEHQHDASEDVLLAKNTVR